MRPAVAEAIAWIEQAEELLDQAHAALKGTEMERTRCDGGWVSPFTIQKLRAMTADLADQVSNAAKREAD